MTNPTADGLRQICSCTWHGELREPGIDCPVHPRPPPGPDSFRQILNVTGTELLPCRLCGSAAELWQRLERDDIWRSFGACSNLEDVDGEPCHFNHPESEAFYCERKIEAVRYWNLIMGPRPVDESVRA